MGDPMRTALYVKTEYSLLKSMIKIDDYIAFAKQNNVSALTIADENLFGAMEFYTKCMQNNIKPILGLTIPYENHPVVLYAKNYQGYQNLLKLSTIHSEREITLEDLQKYANNLICILPVESDQYYETFSTFFPNVYQSFDHKETYDEHKVYMKETLYLTTEEKSYFYYLKAIRLGKLVTSLDKIETDSSYSDTFFTKANQEILDACHFEQKTKENLLPIYPCPEPYSAETYLENLCFEGLKKRNIDTEPYQKRLRYELSVIKKMGFCHYFLIVMDYVNYAKQKNILVGPGRGSAAGSLVSYALEITDIDPLKYGLMFERFLNPERISMPDIDIDFEYTKREEMITYCIQKYGKKRVAPIITFGTLAAKQAIRDVGRCMDIDLKDIDHLCHFFDPNKTLKENYQEKKEIQEFLKESNERKKLYKVAMKLEGMKRHTSVHAAGIVMSRMDLDEIIPLEKHDTYYITGYSMEYLEPLGLWKMDFLAIKNLTLIKQILEDMEHYEHLSLSFSDIPEGDEKALSIFKEANTTGIFQFESEGMKSFLRKLKPNTFEEIFSAIALYRPGPMGNIDSYIRRKNGEEKIDYFHEDLKEVLKPTYGIIVYQEQVMQIAHIMAGYTLAEADLLRRAMSKKKEDILKQEEEKFITQSIHRGYEKNLAEKVYQMIFKFASYGFNRAHAVSYAMIAYKMAYLKYYYSKYFMKNLLTFSSGSESKIREYIYECKQNHISLLPPDINESTNTYQITKEGLRIPLTAIKNIGEASVKEIMEVRKEKPFKDIFDFIARTNGKSVNRKMIENFIYAGCFSKIAPNRKTLIENLDVILNYAEVIKDLGEEFALKPELVMQKEYSKSDLLKKEMELFGFYFSSHPVTAYKAKYPQIVSLSEIPKYFDKDIYTIVFLQKVRKTKTKQNQEMCFFVGADETMTIDLVMFPNVYSSFSFLKEGDILLVKAKVERRYDKYQLVIQKAKKIEEDDHEGNS